MQAVLPSTVLLDFALVPTEDAKDTMMRAGTWSCFAVFTEMRVVFLPSRITDSHLGRVVPIFPIFKAALSEGVVPFDRPIT